uniref:NAD-dependent epimerase/dehydratase family protein n=1 Tax=Methylobacterium sp. B34 TaxID=95563 RepID=UPI000A04368C|nr:NAD-dependent epimerase/dehydratase family protein [Methylobacterium sp. B34]
MRILITGAGGFVGKNILQSSAASGVVFYRVTRNSDAANEFEIPLGKQLWSEDQIRRAINISKPDLILHCAGVLRENNMEELFGVNVALASNLFGAVSKESPETRVIVIGSAAEYGFVPETKLPVTEDFICQPYTNYGISKYSQTLVSMAAARNNINSLVIRLFNPVGINMPSNLALPSFAARVAAASAGDTILVGNIEVERDFIGIEEAARIILAIARRPTWPSPVVNLCSGVATSLDVLLQRLIYFSGKELKISRDVNLARRNEMSLLFGSLERLRSFEVNPLPIEIDEVCRSLLADARRRIHCITESQSTS